MRAALLGYVIFAVIILGGWELIARLDLVDPDLLPPFSQVCAILWQFMHDPRFTADLGVTAGEVGVAFLIAAPLAVSSGFLLGERLLLAQTFNPVVHFILAVPQSIFLPVFILAFGIGFLGKVLFGITHAYFVILVNSFAAVRSIPHPLPNLPAHLSAGDAAPRAHGTTHRDGAVHHRRAFGRDVRVAQRHRPPHLRVGRERPDTGASGRDHAGVDPDHCRQ